MIQERHRIEAENLFRQALRDLESAKTFAKANKFAQAAFFAQQVAEKALQALFAKNGLTTFGIPLNQLIMELPVDEHQVMKGHQQVILTLEKMYIPTNLKKIQDSEYLRSFTLKEVDVALGNLQLLVTAVQNLLKRVAGAGDHEKKEAPPENKTRS